MFDIGAYIPPYFLWIVLVIGLLFAFCGRALWKAIWFIIGGLVGLAIGMTLGFLIGFFIGAALICAVIAGVVGFIVGGYWGISAARFMIAVSGAFTGFWIGSTFGGMIVGIIVAVVVFLIIYLKFDEVLSIATAIMGGLMVGAVAYTLAGGGVWGTVALFVVGIPIIILGAKTQLEIEKRYPHTREGEMQ
jgi:hypothetical protein